LQTIVKWVYIDIPKKNELDKFDFGKVLKYKRERKPIIREF